MSWTRVNETKDNTGVSMKYKYSRDGRLILFIYGTDSIIEMITNFSFRSTKDINGKRWQKHWSDDAEWIHKWLIKFAQVDPKDLVICGHSRGGAVAKILLGSYYQTSTGVSMDGPIPAMNSKARKSIKGRCRELFVKWSCVYSLPPFRRRMVKPESAPFSRFPWAAHVNFPINDVLEIILKDPCWIDDSLFTKEMK